MVNNHEAANTFHNPSQQQPALPMDLLELSIETLLGTSYEVRLSPRTTVVFLKAKLQRSEGIPKHHLHLVYRGRNTFNIKLLHIKIIILLVCSNIIGMR